MRSERFSLIAGRNSRPLEEKDIQQVIRTFYSLDRNSPVRHDPESRTRFRVFQNEEEELCEIVFGPDIFPGSSVVDPNSSLSMRAAAAHELCHYYRYQDKTELDNGVLEEIDEAITSLEAIIRFQQELTLHEIRQLVSDAIQRLQIHAQKYRGPDHGDAQV